MDPGLRALFNRSYTDDVYRRVCALMEERCEEPSFGFRLAELPLILPPGLRGRCESAAREILALARDPGVIAQGRGAVPARYDVPGLDAVPHFMSIDFAIVRGAGGELEPRLIELQAFSSLYGMELVQGEVWGEVLAGMPGMPPRWTSLFSGLERDAYIDMLRRTVVAGEDPDGVILLDLEPEGQKTRADFHVIRRLLGVRAVCASDVVRAGRRLLAPKDGRLVPVRRIFNRVVFDELDRSGTALRFDWRDDLDVTWVAHPNWYWIWSKHTLPRLEHACVPRARVLSEVERLPEDLSGYILKPLFSYAGTGVQIDIDRAIVEAIPAAERGRWLLQEKIAYAPDLVAPDGAGVKAEIRMMFLRPEGEDALTLAINLARLSRGKMHGVDHNRGLAWVGSSIGIWPAD
jgi:hypothetical protein